MKPPDQNLGPGVPRVYWQGPDNEKEVPIMSETPQFHPSAGIELPVFNGDAINVAENSVNVGSIPSADPDGAGEVYSTIGLGLDMGQ